MTQTLPLPLKEQAAFYDQRWDRESQRPLGMMRLQRAAAILYEISLLRKTNPTILDFGCGTGNFTGMLSQVGHVVGIELSPHAVELAKRRMPHIDFRSGNIFDTGIEESAFDIVVLQEVLEHVEDQSELVHRCRSVLKPGGHLILTTPNKTIMHRSGQFAKAEREGTLQPIENLLTVSETRKVVSKWLSIKTSRTIIPAGHTGMLRLINMDRLTRFASWRALRSCLPVGLHTVIVAQRI